MSPRTAHTAAPNEQATQADRAAVRPGLGRRLIWLFAGLAAVLVAGGALWVVLGDVGPPTVTFDGREATYDGPTTFDAGDVTFTFDASAHEPGVGFVVLEITDDSVTIDDVEAWAADHDARTVAPFAGDFDVTIVTTGDRVVEKAVVLEADTRYVLSANTSPTDTDRVYPAAIIEVD